jgi:Hint module
MTLSMPFKVEWKTGLMLGMFLLFVQFNLVEKSSLCTCYRSWDTQYVPKCYSRTYGGYPPAKTTYNEATLRVFNMLVETSTNKIPSTSELGTSKDVLDQNTSGNGHVSRNIRLAIAAIDLVEPYLSIVGVDTSTIVGDFAPSQHPSCDTLPSIVVDAKAKSVQVYWTVGGAMEIDETRVWVANAKNVDTTILQGCAKQPDMNAIMQVFTGGSKLTGFGFLAEGGPNPSHSSTVGPRFSATIDLPQASGRDEFLVMVSARVDSSWASEPSVAAPDIPPQSHLANVRTNPSWKHINANKVVQGRLDWFSLPIRIIRSQNSPGSPTPAPSTSSSPTPPVVCFSGDCEVEVKNKGAVKMSDLAVGDFVKVVPNKYEPVYSFGHKNEYESTEFLQIVTEGGRKPLEISKDHMVKDQNGRSIPASMVKVGDMLLATSGDLVPVKAIRAVVRKGIYAPFTESGFIIVNDIVASNYIAFHESAFLKVGDAETLLSYQWVAHTFNSAHRVAVMMGIVGETYTATGMSRWVYLPYKYSSWVLRQHVIVAWGILLPSIALFGTIAIFETLLRSFISLATIAIVVALLVSRRSVHLRMTKTR